MVSESPNDPKILYELGNTHNSANKLTEAVECF
jgi:hypothetical protein